MKKLIMFITIFVSVILIANIFPDKVKAYDINNVNLSSINTLPYYSNNYTLIYGRLGSYANNNTGLYLMFYNTNRGFIMPTDNNSSSYSPTCDILGFCFNTIRGNTNNATNWEYQRYKATYYSLDNGNTWTLRYSNLYIGETVYNATLLKTTVPLYRSTSPNELLVSSGFEYNEKKFNVDFVQGSVIMANYNGRIGNLVSYYVKPREDNTNIEDYKFCYIENSGGFRDGETCFNLKYWESGEVVNGIRYYYFYNLPLFYNIGLSYNIYDSNDNLIQTDTINAYLSDLPDLQDYSIYNFQNYEYANMSYINSGYFAISSDLINNVDISVTNITNNTTIPFLTSSYYDSANSYIDSNGYQWYAFNFNNDNVYLTIINKVNDITDFWAYVDNYDLKLIFDNSAYVHLSGNASSEENKDNPVNQQSYKDNNGNVYYNDNPVVSDFSDTTGFMSHIKEFFPNINTDTFGLTSIVTAPLNLIQSLVSKTCSPLVLPLPYTNSNLTLPCMTQIYKFYYPLLYDIYELVLYGFISYKVIVNIFYEVMKMRQATINNTIEVLDL